MARRGIEKQLSLPFEAVRVQSVFDGFKPDIEKCHRLQDEPASTSGNEFYWWQSRFGEWLQIKRSGWSRGEYLEIGKPFPSVWESFERFMTRSKPMGVPRAALEL